MSTAQPSLPHERVETPAPTSRDAAPHICPYTLRSLPARRWAGQIRPYSPQDGNEALRGSLRIEYSLADLGPAGCGGCLKSNRTSPRSVP